jgi:hypothetical protein
VSDRSARDLAPQAIRLPFPPVVLAIAGCSGSGKTTLAAELARNLGGIHFPLDNYYRDMAHLPLAERVRQNFDDPALIESSLLATHVAALARGEAIERPLYDFSTHTHIPSQTETIRLNPMKPESMKRKTRPYGCDRGFPRPVSPLRWRSDSPSAASPWSAFQPSSAPAWPSRCSG